MIQKIRKLYNKVQRHFVYKIFLAYFTFFAFLMAIVLLYSSHQMNQRELSQEIYSGSTLLNQTSSYLQYRVQGINSIISTIAYHDSIKQILQDGLYYYSHNTANWNIQTSQGQKEIYYGSYTSSDISKVQLFSTKGSLSLAASPLFSKLDEKKSEEIWHRLETMESNFIWIPGSFFSENDPNLYLITDIASMDNIKQHLGYIISTIPQTAFCNMMEQTAATSGTSVILYNSLGETIAQNSLCLPDFTPQTVSTLSKSYSLTDSGALDKIVYNGTPYLMGVRSIDKSDWRLAMLIPYSDILAGSRQFLKQLILSIVVIMLLSLPIIYLVGRSLTARIVHLKQRITTFYAKSLPLPKEDNSKDEIDNLADSFYQMETHIQTLMKEQYLHGVEIKDLELQILQSQINPHFLYNTLEMLYWMGVKNHASEISNTVRELGEFYKRSLGQGEKIVSLENEICHIEAYIHIQNMRFHNSILFQNNIPASFYRYQIIKVTLQPLIENAINHGIREKESETGCISLDGSLQDNRLHITIRDDGVGMDSEQLANICRKRTHSSGHGYGVWNINERIKLTYGEKYGLRYSSKKGQGTTVTIVLPALLKE